MPPSDHLFSVFLWNESEEFIGARWGTTFVGAELYSKSAQVSITNMETNNTEESLHEERRARCSSTVLESNHGLYFFLKHEPHDLESFFYYHCCIRGCSSEEETNPPNSSPRPSKTSTKTVKRKNELKRSQEKRSHFSKYGNGSGLVRVEKWLQKSKPEPAPNSNSGYNLSQNQNPRIPETRRIIRNPKKKITNKF